jgi:Short C-terminal domain
MGTYMLEHSDGTAMLEGANIVATRRVLGRETTDQFAVEKIKFIEVGVSDEDSLRVTLSFDAGLGKRARWKECEAARIAEFLSALQEHATHVEVRFKTHEARLLLGASEQGGDIVDLGQELDKYDVTYLGGLPDYPSKKVGKINLILRSSGFELRPTLGSRSWFAGFVIPYSGVADVILEQRVVGTAEALLSGLNSRQLNQANNIHIIADGPNGQLVLRLEMLTGVTVMGQAKKCREFMDRLLTLEIRNQFQQSPPLAPQPTGDDPMRQLERLAELHDKGILTDEEFSLKKAEILKRL